MKIEPASVEDHQVLVKVAKSSTYTKHFSNRVMFSSDAAYEKGWIRKAVVDGELVGFTCVRHKVRLPETMLYFIVVVPDWRSKGVGEALIQDLLTNSPSGRVVLNVAEDNVRAIEFYHRLGFARVYCKDGMHRMEKMR